MSHEVIARGVCMRNGKILLCYPKNKSFTYLPGGHVEPMEKATDALAREVQEELGLKPIVGKFLGCNEHAFMQDGNLHSEINLIFELDVPDLSDTDKTISACEEWIGFSWFDLNELPHINLLPQETVDWIQTTNPSTFATYGVYWQ